MKNAKDMKALGNYGTVGLEIVLSVLFGLFIGMKLDEWLHTKPWMTVVWFGFGCAAAGRSVYRSWKSMQIAAKREEDEEGNPEQSFPDDKSLAWKREEERARRQREDAERGAAASAESPVENGQESATKSDQAEKRDE